MKILREKENLLLLLIYFCELKKFAFREDIFSRIKDFWEDLILRI